MSAEYETNVTTPPQNETTAPPTGSSLSGKLKFDVAITTIFFFCVSIFLGVSYFRFQYKVRKAYKNRASLFRDVDTRNWIDPEAYNGQNTSGGQTLEIDIANLGLNGRRGSKVSAKKMEIKPLDRITKTEEMQAMLELYYSAHQVMTMTKEDISIIVDQYFPSKELRQEFDEILTREHGEGLNAFISKLERGTLKRPKNVIKPAQKKSEQPSVNIVGEKPMGRTQEGIELTLRTDLKTALERRQLGHCYEQLNEAGIDSLVKLKDVSFATIRDLFPDRDAQTKLLELAEVSQMLYIAEMH